MASKDLDEISSGLQPEIGEIGLNYLAPQMDIMRLSRALPKNLEDFRLVASRFYETLRLIEAWIDPLSDILIAELAPLEDELQALQRQTRFLLDDSKTKSWYEAKNHSNPRIPALLKEIDEKRTIILEKRSKLLLEARKNDIINLLGLVLYPYSPQIRTLENSINFASNKYYGPNTAYKKSNKFTDALIFILAAQSVLSKSREQAKGIVADYEDIFRMVKNEPQLEEIEYLYKAAKGEKFMTKGINMRQVTYLVSRVLNRPGLTFIERSMMNNEFYMDSIDRYRIDKVLSWLSNEIYGDTKGALPPQDIKDKNKEKGDRKYLFGLSFLDKHNNKQTIGNIPENSISLIEAVLSIFHELKQNQTHLEAAQFELTTQIYGLPEQAWLYDFTGIKSEILRSTMLLMSDRIPKFDLLEACQRLSTAVLSGRVDRNDNRVNIDGPVKNYIETSLLPQVSWDYISESLVEILEEVMVREEEISTKIIREIFAEEDRSKLVTSKKFNPVFYIELSIVKKGIKDKYNPRTITIYSRPGFDFQYRHAQASGYPWYFDQNELFQKLVETAMNEHLPKEVIELRKVILNIDNEKFIFYYESSKVSDIDYLVKILTFKEAPDFEDGITPVEVLFRPKKFMAKKPIDNGLELLIENARASDPKDLETLISNL